jgi:hypothetical protein
MRNEDLKDHQPSFVAHVTQLLQLIGSFAGNIQSATVRRTNNPITRGGVVMRLILFAFGSVAFGGGMSYFSSGRAADKPAEKTASWEGTYFKYAQFDSGRQGQFGEAKQLTITKDGDVYRLSKPYDGRRFTEIRKGVLSDVQGGIGKIHFGSAEFADGKRVRVLRADFCYEYFILYEVHDATVK